MRLEGWETRLAELVDDFSKRSFDWETCNCGHLAVANIVAMHGHDMGHGDWPEMVSSSAQLVRRLRKAGHTSIADLMAAHLQPVPPVMARRGDLCVVESDGFQSACVMVERHAFGLTEKGHIRLPRNLVMAAFQV